MVSKLELITSTVLVLFLAVINPIQPTETTHNLDGRYNNVHDDITLDPNYETLVGLHAKSPESYPPEIWKDMLAELRFGPSLKMRLAQAQTEAGSEQLSKLPNEFDARKKWKACKRLIGAVHDQGACLADYAIAPASVLADRLCIKKKGKFRDLLSSQALLGCYGSCQDGGLMYASFEYLNKTGVPTGGLYGEKKGCIPFEPQPCSHRRVSESSVGEELQARGKLPDCSSIPEVNYTCPNACTNNKYGKKMDQDLHKASEVVYFGFNEEYIRREIFNNGPVAAAFALYDDFKNYRSGVYRRSASANYEGHFHKVKLIGWGSEAGDDYWLGVNSYNKKWGMKGLFKYPRNDENYGITSQMMAVVPQY